MLARSHRLEADERNLHTGKSTNGIPGRISNIEPVSETTHEDENKSMQRNHVRNECVTAFGYS
jgi:hypothetical protein